MRLFIGNGTRQNLTFAYFIPGENFKIYDLKIAVGKQEMIPQDLTAEELTSIIEQHRRYGLVEAKTIDSTKYFCGTCYSVGTPIPSTKLNMLMRLNIGVLDAQGKKIREAAAVASSQVLTKSLMEVGGSNKLEGFEFTIQQEEHSPNDPMAQVSEGIRVMTDPSKNPEARRGRRAA